MAEEKSKETKERKILVEREYIVPLRREWLKVPKFKRANKALRALKEFMVQHMKVYDRDLRKIKVDTLLNNEIRFMGMRKPLPYVKVKAIKYDSGIVEVKLVQLPKHIEFQLARNIRKEAERAQKQSTSPKEEAKEEKKEETQEEIKDTKEKEEASKEATQEEQKHKAKEAKHTSGMKKEPTIHRKVMQR